MLDNTANLLLMVGLLAGVYGFPTNFALRHMIPGTAIGVRRNGATAQHVVTTSLSIRHPSVDNKFALIGRNSDSADGCKVEFARKPWATACVAF